MDLAGYGLVVPVVRVSSTDPDLTTRKEKPRRARGHSLVCFRLPLQIPFRLEALGYDQIGSKTGWLVAAYAAGLIVSSPPIAYIGGRVKGKRTPLIIALLFMAGGEILRSWDVECLSKTRCCELWRLPGEPGSC